MNYRTLGRSDLKVSEIGFGCMSMLRNSPTTAKELVRAAVNAGINYFDTADLYDKGENERTIGRILKPVRKDIILATKVGNQLRKDGSGWDWNPRKAYIIKAVEDSLERLQTDYIDLYQLHGGTIDDPIEETIEAFEQLVQQGKIKYYGISSIRPNVISIYANQSNIISVMLQYSLLDRRPEETVLDLLASKGIGVLARGALAQGLLTGKAPKPYLKHQLVTIQAAANMLSREAALYHTTSAVLATKYVLQHQAVSGVVTGLRTMQQLNEVIAPVPENHIHENWLKDLQSSIPSNKYEEHR